MLLTPYPEYPLCARSFNDYHLALMLRLVKNIHDGLRYPKGYTNKPACALWKDCENQLYLYGIFLVDEAKKRNLPDPRDWSWIVDEYKFRGLCDPPFWLGIPQWHSYHRGLMHQNDEAFYSAMFIKTGVGIRFDDTFQRESIFAWSPDEKARMTAHHVNKIMAGRICG